MIYPRFLRISTGHAKMLKKTKEKLHKIFGYAMAAVAVILVIVVFGGAYYFVIAPNMISKPDIPKPEIPENALISIRAGDRVIQEDNINYLVNELGGYKLKTPFASDNIPIVEVVLNDIGAVYYTYVQDHVPKTKLGNAKNEDIRIKAEQEVILNILNSDNVQGEAEKANDNGDIQVELVADMKTLAAKGYLSLYDNFK
jgi:hypothetical protein